MLRTSLYKYQSGSHYATLREAHRVPLINRHKTYIHVVLC